MIELALAPLLWGCGAGSRVPEPDAGQGTRSPTRAPSAVATEEPPPRPRGSDDWRIDRQSRRGEVAAYTTHASGLPGTRVGLKVSTTEGGWEAAAFRIGSYAGGTGAFVWESGFRLGRRQPPARFSDHGTRTVVAPWARDLTVDTSGWPPGFYVFRLRTDTGWETQVPYVVTSPSAAGTVALAVPPLHVLRHAVDGHGARVEAGLDEVLERRGHAVVVGDGDVAEPRRRAGVPRHVELQARRVRAKREMPGRHGLDDVEAGEDDVAGSGVPPRAERLVGQPRREHRPVGVQALTGHDEAELVQPAELGQVRAGEGNVRQVEVFWMVGVGTSIFRGPRRLYATTPAASTTPSSVMSQFRLLPALRA